MDMTLHLYVTTFPHTSAGMHHLLDVPLLQAGNRHS
jgi:hypothetical protein